MNMNEKNNDPKEVPVNEGWQQMHSMLDVHLPVEKKNRKAIFWWWLPVSFFVTILMVKCLFFNDSKLPVSANDEATVATIEQVADNIIKSKSVVAKVESASKSMAKGEFTTDEQKLILMSKVALNENKKEGSITGLINTKAIKKIANKSNATFAHKESRKQKRRNTESVNTQLKVEQRLKTKTAVNSPRTKDLSDISISEKLAEIKMDTTVATNNIDSIFAMNSNADSTNKYQSTEIIALLTMPKKSIYMDLGFIEVQALSIGMQWPINKTFSFDLAVTDLVKSNLLQSKSQPQYMLQNTTYRPQMMNYISINAGINTHLLPKWDIALQPFFAILTHTSGDVFYYLNTQGNNGTSLLTASILNAADSKAKYRTTIFEKNQEPYNNIDFGLRFSVAFHINNKWSTMAFYQFGINSIAKKEYFVYKNNVLVSGYNSAAYNCFFNIGIKYKIH
jgi:hypothetical protein